MLARFIPLAALLVASPVLAQSPSDNASRPKPKAARVPARPKIPTTVRPSIKHDAEPDVTSDRPAAPPVPAQQVTELGKTIAGTYRCTGSFANVEGGLRRTSARLKVGTDLDGYWITYDITENKDATAYPMKIHIARTYSDAARAWQSVMTDNRGGLQVTTAEHGDEQAVTWLGNTHKDGAKALVRAHDDRDDHAGQIRLWGELSADGSTYTKQYDLTCTNSDRR